MTLDHISIYMYTLSNIDYDGFPLVIASSLNATADKIRSFPTADWLVGFDQLGQGESLACARGRSQRV